jgi:hypothetical protein
MRLNRGVITEIAEGENTVNNSLFNKENKQRIKLNSFNYICSLILQKRLKNGPIAQLVRASRFISGGSLANSSENKKYCFVFNRVRRTNKFSVLRLCKKERAYSSAG